MMLNVGMIAKTFGMLPSQVIENANTYDLMIADVMSTWEDYQYKKANKKITTPDISQEKLQAILNKGKGKK